MDKKVNKDANSICFMTESMTGQFKRNLVMNTMLFVLAIIGFSLLPGACGSANAFEKSDANMTKEDKIMEPKLPYTPNAYAVPPIDDAAPKKVETATFALG